jgi:hypothetical protein
MIRAVALAVVLFASAAQAEPAFSDWLDAVPGRRAEVVALERYLDKAHVGDVLGPEDLLRNASSWRSCGLSYPWSMPPRELWPHVVPTLRFIRDQVVPEVGPVMVESGWREPKLNACAGGAPRSAHALYYALDLVPQDMITRRELIATVCRLHARKGKGYSIGLGFYDGVRFHIDSKAYRRWGSDNHSKTSPCSTFTG